MLYHFLVPLAKDHIVFNVFRYVTFRSFMALIFGLVISLVIGPWLIRRLRRMQHGAETIREDTPERHLGKRGTPTMGGVVILTAILSSTLLWANLLNRYVWVVMLSTAGFGAVTSARAHLPNARSAPANASSWLMSPTMARMALFAPNQDL